LSPERNPLQRLQMLLFDCLLRNEPHLGSTDRLKNRSRVPRASFF